MFIRIYLIYNSLHFHIQRGDSINSDREKRKYMTNVAHTYSVLVPQMRAIPSFCANRKCTSPLQLHLSVSTTEMSIKQLIHEQSCLKKCYKISIDISIPYFQQDKNNKSCLLVLKINSITTFI